DARTSEDAKRRARECLLARHGVPRTEPGPRRSVIGSDEGVLRLLFSLVVAVEHARSADPKLADFGVLPSRPVAASRARVADSRLDRRQWKTDATRKTRTRKRVGDADTDLGHSKALERDPPRDRLPSLRDRHRQRRASTGRESQALCVVRPSRPC